MAGYNDYQDSEEYVAAQKNIQAAAEREVAEAGILLERAEKAEASVRALEAVIEGDRTKIIAGVNGISDALRRRQWLLTSRGSYEWDDERFLGEFRDAINEIDAAVEPLRIIGADKTNCPQTTSEVIKARTSIDEAINRAEKVEEELSEARAKLGDLANASEVSGFSWSGFNVIGDKKSIAALQSAVHYGGQIDKYRSEFLSRNAAKEAELADLRAKAEKLAAALKPFAEAWEIAMQKVDPSKSTLGDICALAKHHANGTAYRVASAALAEWEGKVGD